MLLNLNGNVSESLDCFRALTQTLEHVTRDFTMCSLLLQPQLSCCSSYTEPPTAAAEKNMYFYSKSFCHFPCCPLSLDSGFPPHQLPFLSDCLLGSLSQSFLTSLSVIRSLFPSTPNSTAHANKPHCYNCWSVDLCYTVVHELLEIHLCIPWPVLYRKQFLNYCVIIQFMLVKIRLVSTWGFLGWLSGKGTCNAGNLGQEKAMATYFKKYSGESHGENGRLQSWNCKLNVTGDLA